MPANTSPIWGLTPNVGRVSIATTTAVPKSDGSSTGATVVLMMKVFTAGANGSYVDRVRFFAVASAAAVTSVATTLRVFISTVNSAPSATTAADTFLIGEISVPAVSAAHSTNATNYYDVILEQIIPTGTYILVTQHVAQTANQNWNAICYGSDY